MENKDDKDVVQYKLFQILLIMTKVVSSMPQKDLIQLRSTCKLWNKIMVSELQKNHSPQCSISGECAGVVNGLGSLARTLRHSNASGGILPFIKHLEIRTRRGLTGAEDELFTRAPVLDLLFVCGSHLTRLEIRCWHGYSPSARGVRLGSVSISSLRHVLFNCTPALMELGLDLFTIDREADDSGDRLTYRELPCLRKLKFKLVGNLESVPLLQGDLLRAATELTSLDVGQARDYVGALHSIFSNSMACHLLQELNISFTGYDTIPEMLLAMGRNKGLKLRQLTVRIYSLGRNTRKHIQRTLIREFFSSQANYMKHLSIEVSVYPESPNETQFLVQIPQMDALESLIIIATRPILAMVHFEDCPVLNSLSLSHKVYAWDICLSPLSTSPVRELKLLGCCKEGVESSEMVNRLAGYFPCLTRMTIRLWRWCLPRVWTKWPALQCLDLTVLIDEDPMDDGEVARFLDHDLTGIGAENCELLGRRIAAGEIDYEYYEEARRMKTSPGITDLKELRQFALSCTVLSGKATEVTDVTGYYAFAAPETKLQQISIQSGANFSDKCRAAIQQRLGLAAKYQFGCV